MGRGIEFTGEFAGGISPGGILWTPDLITRVFSSQYTAYI